MFSPLGQTIFLYKGALAPLPWPEKRDRTHDAQAKKEPEDKRLGSKERAGNTWTLLKRTRTDGHQPMEPASTHPGAGPRLSQHAGALGV